MENTKIIINRALAYLRVSTDRQAAKGLSIPAQKERCLQWVKDNGYELDEATDIYIDEGESARTSNRPQFQILWERCRNDKTVKAVAFYDISRLARNRIDFALVKQDLEKRGIRICSVTEGIDETPSGQLLEGVLSTVAEFFSLQSGEKVKTGMIQKFNEGWWPLMAPYGYKNVQERQSSGKVKSWIEVNWDEAKWVTRAFELFATGQYSTKTLAVKLLSEGFPMRPRKDNTGRLHSSFLNKMFRNKFYIGTIKWKNMTISKPLTKHELFLDRSLFEKVQAIMDSRLGGASRNRRLLSVLKHVSYCDECGSKMSAEETKTSNKVIRYLRCLKSQHSENVKCGQSYTHEEIYLDQFMDILKLIKLPGGVVEKLHNRIKALFSSEQEVYEKARTDILNQIESVKRKKKNLVLQLLDKEESSQSDMEMYEGIKVELNDEELRLNDELAKAESKISAVVRTTEIAIALAASCYYAYKQAKEPALQTLLTRTLIKKLYMRNGKIVRVILNEPLDYVCYSRLKKYPIFELGAVSGQHRDRTYDLSDVNGTLYH